MTLLSPLALLFAATALVPLLLHLYQRRRRVVVLFSTNRFFTKSVVRSQRSLRLRRLLLLLLRMAACILFALALARPILGLAGLARSGTGSRDIVILLDDSLSMHAKEKNDVSGVTGHDGARPLKDIEGQTPSRFDRAKAAALEVLNTLASGDRAAIVTSSGRTLGQDSRSGTQLSADINRQVEQVQQLKAIPAAGDAPRCPPAGQRTPARRLAAGPIVADPDRPAGGRLGTDRLAAARGSRANDPRPTRPAHP